MMRCVFIGTVAFSARLFEHILSRAMLGMVGAVTCEQSAFNADFQSLAPIAERAGLPCLQVKGRDQRLIADWIRNHEPDVVFCMGWPYLLEPAILSIPPLGVIGYHPALLPRNRGRHPIIWALALGLTETGSSFFVMDEGADSGDIVSQVRVPIAPEDDAASLYARLGTVATKQVDEITDGLLHGTLVRTPQNPDDATTWRRRSASDGAIDWRMPAPGIYNLIRALTRPYVGAHCMHRGREAKIWRSRIVNGVASDIEPGKVIAVTDEGMTVKCGEGAILLLEHDLPCNLSTGEYL